MFYISVTLVVGTMRGWLTPFWKGLLGAVAFRNRMSLMPRQALPLSFGSLISNAKWALFEFFASHLGPAEAAAWALLGSIWEIIYRNYRHCGCNRDSSCPSSWRQPPHHGTTFSLQVTHAGHRCGLPCFHYLLFNVQSNSWAVYNGRNTSRDSVSLRSLRCTRKSDYDTWYAMLCHFRRSRKAQPGNLDLISVKLGCEHATGCVIRVWVLI